MAKRIESRPTAGLCHNSTEAKYWDRAGLDKEVERVFDICHGLYARVRPSRGKCSASYLGP